MVKKNRKNLKPIVEKECPVNGKFPFKEIDSCLNKVWDIMYKIPQTRNSDKLLWLAYLQFYCDAEKRVDSWNSFKLFLMDKEVLQMATVIRCRAKIQEAGYFWGENKKERMSKSESFKNYFSPYSDSENFDNEYQNMDY